MCRIYNACDKWKAFGIVPFEYLSWVPENQSAIRRRSLEAKNRGSWNI